MHRTSTLILEMMDQRERGRTGRRTFRPVGFPKALVHVLRDWKSSAARLDVIIEGEGGTHSSCFLPKGVTVRV